MKHSKKILILWTSAAIVAMLWGGIALHGNARQGRAEAKKMAIQTLRSVAEQAVNREFEKLEIYRFLENKGDKKHTKRKNISKAGEFEIEVDSLKEAQGLYPLEIAGTKANILDDLGKFPLEQIGSQWKAEMNVRYGGMVCALSLEVHPLGSDDVRKVSVGDTTIIASRYDLGTYYLDDMYTMQLTAYALPGFWYCVDWANPLLWAMSGLFLCIACAGGLSYARSRKHKKTEKANVPVTAYQIGGCIYDSIQHTLAYGEETKDCTPQLAKLLLGFAQAPDFFLTNDKIDAICNWPSDDLGLNDRRRQTISSLKKLLSMDPSIQIQFVRGKRGYQLVISSDVQTAV